jgi:hypothetical protein
MKNSNLRKAFYGSVLAALLLIIASLRSDMSTTGEGDWRRGVFFALLVLVPGLVSHSLWQRIVQLRDQRLLRKAAHAQYTATSRDEAKAIIEYEAITTAEVDHGHLIRALKERYDTAYQQHAKTLPQSEADE